MWPSEYSLTSVDWRLEGERKRSRITVFCLLFRTECIEVNARELLAEWETEFRIGLGVEAGIKTSESDASVLVLSSAVSSRSTCSLMAVAPPSANVGLEPRTRTSASTSAGVHWRVPFSRAVSNSSYEYCCGVMSFSAKSTVTRSISTESG